jgi:hypothetical protein
MSGPAVQDTAGLLDPALVAAVGGLLKLHALTVKGLGQTPEADAIRDEMEESWGRLGPEETAAVNHLSEVLWALNDRNRATA